MKYVLCAVLMASTFLSFSQVSTGRLYASANLSLYARSNPEIANTYLRHTTLNISPSLGFVVRENLVLGGVLGYDYKYSSYGYDFDSFESESKGSQVNVGLFAKKYLKLIDHVFFSFSGQAVYGRQRSRSTTTSNGTVASGESKYNVLDFSFKPGIAFFPTSKWAIEGSVGNLSYLFHRSATDSSKAHEVNATFGAIGFSISRFF